MTAFFISLYIEVFMDEKRFNELYNRAYSRGYTCCTDFLNMEEQSILEKSKLPCLKYGGYPSAERIVALFGESIAQGDIPVSLLEIAPASQKFADRLGHRDFLGGLMHLGIKRETLGDIIVFENTGYLFCLKTVKDYIIDNLSKVKHTTVSVKEVDSLPQNAVAKPESTEIITASLRLDAIISAVYRLSRSESSKLFAQEKVFVNSIAAANTSYQVKENDIISVRGFGRIQFISKLRTTKKDRIVIEILKY